MCKHSGGFLLGSGLHSDSIFELCTQIDVPREVRIFEAAEPLFSHQQHLPDHGLQSFVLATISRWMSGDWSHRLLVSLNPVATL